ncbi:alkaline phosphatase PhoX [Propionivibrio sp.]|uniref:alkaline phosphatase PhoX n=1 Tax=Propionivibrio sp. TaxID=2212460 RepID=UPI003BF0BF9F
MSPQMHRNALAFSISLALLGLSSHPASAAGKPKPDVQPVKVEFTATPVAQSDTDLLKTYTTSVARVTFTDGSRRDFPLSYVSLFKNTDRIGRVSGKNYAAGQLFDVTMAPIMDPNGDPVIAETADANSLLKIGDKLFLVNHWEYDDVLADGQTANKAKDWYSRMPMSMSLSEIVQGKEGKLQVKSQKPVDFSSVNGGWIFCFGSQTPWNTHIGGEEDYDLYFVPGEKEYKTTVAGLKAMSEVYFRKTSTANPYHHGYHTEVAVAEDGGYEVTKHYQMGRGTWEMSIFAKDGKTAFYGDDGSYSGLFMFVANIPNMPKAGGTLYAAKWVQTAPDDADGGTADFRWVRLGASHYNEVKALIDSGITINDIFEVSMQQKEGFIPTRAGSAETIWLKLKPGMEKAAAFLETRRYAAYLGATTEFTKGEGVAINHVDKKVYYAMSYIQGSMKAKDGGPVDDIRLKENKAGATYTFDLGSGQKDTTGAAIASEYVPVRAYVEPALLGRPIATDALGNTADTEFVANTDNVFFSEKMRTLFIGEDSGAHQNNYLWAYNVDTKKLTRILSLAAGAESTGLQVVDELGGHAYIMSNNQHQGDWIKSTPAELKNRLEKKAGELSGKNRHGTTNFRLEAHVGYIGGLPAFK